MNKTPVKKKNNGCLWLICFCLLSIFAWVFIMGFTGINSTLSGIGGLIIAGYLTSQLLGRPNIPSLIGYAGLMAMVLLGLKFFTGVVLETVQPVSEEKPFSNEEGVKQTTQIQGLDTLIVYTSHRSWKDNYGNYFEGDLTVLDDDYERLKNKLNTWTASDPSMDFWGELYQFLEKSDGPSLDLITNMFEEIHEEENLNQMEFAEMIVSCIQDIPYSFIFQEPCMPAENYERDIRRILEDCPECCMGNVRYGIQNPVSFMQNLKGDCDTRTVIVYSILKHFNYDVAIMNSAFYRHSILGINLPGAGDYKIYKGKKYRAWETTAKYFEAGTLPSSFNDMTHWNVILTSK